MSTNSNVKLLCQLVLFGLILISVLATPTKASNKHRRHADHALFVSRREFTDPRSEKARSFREYKGYRNKPKPKMRSMSLLHSSFMPLPSNTARFINGDVQLYRMNALALKEGRLRSSPFLDKSMGSTMKRILLRMN